ncbi:MAG: hypothetical protein ABI885_20310 [Gammaproteobacteria bacterium]
MALPKKTVAPLFRFNPQPDSAAAWRTLKIELARALADLNEDDFVIVSSKRGNQFVQFIGQGAHGMRAEAVSNDYLDELHQLSREALATLEALGWHAPTHDRSADGRRPADGSPNFFLDVRTPVAYARIAALAVHTLWAAFGIRHPGELEYLAFSDGQGRIRIPRLKLKAAQPNVARTSRGNRQKPAPLELPVPKRIM